MNRDAAKKILLLYRTEADAADPQIAEALVLAKMDSELSRWLEQHLAAQNALRAKFRQIEIPGGLAQQIVSEQKAKGKRISRTRQVAALAAACAIILAIIAIAGFNFLPAHRPSATLADFQKQMINFASSPYGMPLATNDLTQIHDYLAQNHGIADYTLPAPLEKAAATGCAVKHWDGSQISMICFSTGKPLPKNQPGDLWLFVVDRSAVKDAPQTTSPQIATVNGVTAAVWTQGGKLYLLGVEGDEQTLRKFL